VISPVDPSMDSAFSSQAKKIYQTVAEFAAGFRLYRRKENQAPE